MIGDDPEGHVPEIVKDLGGDVACRECTERAGGSVPAGRCDRVSDAIEQINAWVDGRAPRPEWWGSHLPDPSSPVWRAA